MTAPQPLETLVRTDMDGYDQAHTMEFVRSTPGLEEAIREAVALVHTWQSAHPDSVASQVFTIPEGHHNGDTERIYGPAVVDVTLYWDPRTDDPDHEEFGDSPPLGLTLDIPRHPSFFTVYEEDDQYFEDIKEPQLDQLEADLNALFAERGFTHLINAGLYY